MLNTLYTDDINPYYISLHYREENKIEGEEYTYGEIVANSFSQMLITTNPKPREVFYDLGCGAGKAVFSAALLFPFLKVKGIELLPPLFEICTDLKHRFDQLIVKSPTFKKEHFDIEFLQGDLTQKDFLDGTLFFLNATCFSEEDWRMLQKKLSKLSVGARLIIVTRQLDIKNFKLIDARTYQMSWGPSSVYIYQKLK